MDYLLISTLLYSLAYVQGASPKLTLPNLIHYVNDSIRISCDSVISAGIVSVDIVINNTDLKYHIACRQENHKWVAPQITGMISDDNCVTLPDSGSVSLGITTRIVERMRSSTVTCKVSYYEGRVNTEYDVKENAFSDTYVEPSRLEFDEFEFDDEVPVLNKKTRALCLSFGGYPESEFIYEVRSKSDVIVYSITELTNGIAEFTVNDQLKAGFKVTCRDKVHTRGAISLTKQNCGGTDSELCMPHYITSKVLSNVLSLNPNYSNPVKCDVEGYPSDKIIYTWTSDGKVLPAAAAATYIIPADMQKEGKTEILSCRARHDTYEIDIPWTITWSLRATTTTKPTDTGSSSAGLAIGVGVGVSIAVVIIAVVGGVILYKKKRDNSSRYQSTSSAPDSTVVRKHEKPTNKGSPLNNGGHPSYSKSGDHIIYAELDKDILGNIQSQPVKTNHKYAQETLHPDKTRKLANKLINYCSLPESC